MGRPAAVSLPAGTELRRHDAGSFTAYADRAVAIYSAAMQRGPEVTSARYGVMAVHLRVDGFTAVGAHERYGGELVGFAYGYPGRPGQWWHDAVAAALGPPRREAWLADCFEIAEFHVDPRLQAHGIGRRLLAALLADRPEGTAVLSTHDQESPARRLYRGFGFADLLTGFRFPGGSEVFAVMGRRRPAGEDATGTAGQPGDA